MKVTKITYICDNCGKEITDGSPVYQVQESRAVISKEAAKKCVNGDRDHKYGNPENNFTSIATLWSFYRMRTIRRAQITTSTERRTP